MGRLDAALGVLGRSFGDSEPSWTVLGASLGPLGALRGAWKAAPRRKTISGLSVPGVSRGVPGYFASGTPQGPPRAREEEYCKAVTGDLNTPLARWAGEFTHELVH